MQSTSAMIKLPVRKTARRKCCRLFTTKPLVLTGLCLNTIEFFRCEAEKNSARTSSPLKNRPLSNKSRAGDEMYSPAHVLHRRGACIRVLLSQSPRQRPQSRARKQGRFPLPFMSKVRLICALLTAVRAFDHLRFRFRRNLLFPICGSRAELEQPGHFEWPLSDDICRSLPGWKSKVFNDLAFSESSLGRRRSTLFVPHFFLMDFSFTWFELLGVFSILCRIPHFPLHVCRSVDS